jgi:HAD superfamily hydrolase (TIGR01509 family)
MPAPPSGFSFKSGPYPGALLCDMDGLLLDTEQLSKASFEDLAKERGIPGADQIYPHLMGLSKPGHIEVFRSSFPAGVDAEAFDVEWKRRFHARLSAGDIPVKDGVRDFLSQSRKLELPVAVVTSTMTALAEELLGRAGLMEFFIAVIGGDQVENGKPHPDIYLRAAEEVSVAASDCLALEDSNNGVLAAHRAGVKTIQIPDLAPQSDEAARLGIPVLSSIADVPSYLGWT